MRTRLLMVAAFAVALACSSDSITDPVSPLGLRLSISPKVDTLFFGGANGVGSVGQLSVSATVMRLPVPTPPGRVFETADSNVVLVDSRSGLMQAVGVGIARVWVRVNTEKDYATVIVLPIPLTINTTASGTQMPAVTKTATPR